MGRLLAAAFLRLDSTCPSCVFISWRGFAVVCLAVAAGTVGRVSRRGSLLLLPLLLSSLLLLVRSPA